MTTDDLYPYLLPFVPGAPAPTVDQHARAAAREFLRRTQLWRVSANTITTVADQATYAVAGLPAAVEVIKLLAVRTADKQTDYAKACAFDPLTYSVTFDAAPPAGQAITPIFAVAPAVGTIGQSWSIPDAFKAFSQQIAYGALASLKRLASELGESDRYGAMFDDAVTTAAVIAQRSHGRMRPVRPAAAQFF